MLSLTSAYLQMIFGKLPWEKSVWKIISYLASFSYMNLQSGFLSEIMTVMKGIAASLIILYLYEQLISAAEKEMLSTQQLVIIFVRVIVAISIVINMGAILNTVGDVGHSMYKTVDSTSISSSNAHGGVKFKVLEEKQRDDMDDYLPNKTHSSKAKKIMKSKKCKTMSAKEFFKLPLEWDDDGKDKYAQAGAIPYTGALALVKNFGATISMLLQLFIGYIALAASLLVCSGQTLALMVKIAFAPIPIARAMDSDLSKSSSMKFLRGLFATAVTCAIVLTIHKLTGYVITQIMTNSAAGLGKAGTTLSVCNMSEFINSPRVIITLILKCAEAGTLVKAPQLAKELLDA